MQVKRNCSTLAWGMAAFSGASLWLVTQVVQAATYVVDDMSDAVDANIGDGVCASASPGAGCSLRAAIQEANALPSAAGDRIELPAGTFTLSLTGSAEDAAASGDLDITTSLVITGAGAADTVIDGGEIDRVLDIGPGMGASASGIAVTLRGLSVRGGLVAEEFEAGGGVRFEGSLVVDSVLITQNTAAYGGGIAAARTIGVAKSLRVVDSTLSGNVALTHDGGGILAEDATSLEIVRSVIRENRASSQGGGVHYNGSEPAYVVDTLFSENRSDSGGGIRAACLEMSRSLVSANAVTGVGGGIVVDGGCDSHVVNTTVSGNSADFQGGGVFVIGGGGSLTLTHVTVTQNLIAKPTVDVAGGGAFRATGFETKVLSLQSSIVAGNGTSDCGGAAIASLGGNLASDATCNLTQPGDLPNTDALLAPLADNGGRTQTHALPEGSPAVDAALDPTDVEEDQRGVARPADGDGDGAAVSDIGAYERAGKQPPEDPCKCKCKHRHKHKHKHKHCHK